MDLYIGNFDYLVTIDQIKNLVDGHAAILSSRMIVDFKRPGYNKGFCFVEVDDENGPAVIAALNGKEFCNRTLVVNEARPRNY